MASALPLATAFVLVLAVLGPVLARYSDAITDLVRPPAGRAAHVSAG